MMNFLEQLVAEWYEFSGYFVRRNVLVGRRPKGGYECELDVVAFHPGAKRLVHIEPSMDSDSWSVRETRFAKKFNAGRKYIPKLFDGLDLPTQIEQIALIGYGGGAGRDLGGGKVQLVGDFMREIRPVLAARRTDNQAVPEQYVILRSLQYAANYWR